MARLRIPAVLAVTIVGAAGAVATAVSCGGDKPPNDAALCAVLCVPIGGGSSDNCPLPTCATGPADDMCPAGCTPTPIA